MAINSLYPGFVKLFYTSNAHTHIQTIPVQVYSGVGGAWFTSEKGSSVGRVWDVSLADYEAVFRALVPTTGTVNFAELWTMDTPTSDPIFRESVDYSHAGTNGSAAVANSQVQIPCRSQNGGLYRWMQMEGVILPNSVQQPPFAGSFAALRTYLLGNTSMVSARDGGFLIATLRLLAKTNDKLREKFVLDV